MKPKTMILIAAAVGCGLIASYMTSRLLADRAKDQPVEEEKVAVLVAINKVPMGTFIKEPEKYFKKKEFTKSQAPAKALSEFDQVKEKRLNKPLGTDQFVTTEDLLDGKNGDFSALLPAGMRAMTLRANLETTGGFVLPNTRVDLIVTVRNGNESWSRIIMQNMLVLAVDTQQVRDEKNAIVPTVVTLAATPDESEKLAMASSMGEIRFVLRPFGEDKAIATRGARPSDLARTNSQTSSGVKEGDEPDGTLPPSVASKFPSGVGKPAQPATPEPTQPEAPPPLRTHTLVIENGAELTRTVYVLDSNGKVIPRDVEKQDVPPKADKPTRPEKSAPASEPSKPEKGSGFEPRGPGA